MNKFFASFTTKKGDIVDMSIPEIIIYGLLPIFGQLLMRVNKFGGSLDKPYLFFPLLLIPPFSFIPVLVGKFGFLKKETGVDMIDIYVLIPIIFRFIFVFVAAYIGSIGGGVLETVLILIAIFLANLKSIVNEQSCKDIKGEFSGKIFKSVFDSLMQYNFGALLLFAITFIPIFGGILEGVRTWDSYAKISAYVDTAIWSCGLIFGYMIMNMIDVNYSTPTERCTGNISIVRILISIIAFGFTIFYQFRKQITNFLYNK